MPEVEFWAWNLEQITPFKTVRLQMFLAHVADISDVSLVFINTK